MIVSFKIGYCLYSSKDSANPQTCNSKEICRNKNKYAIYAYTHGPVTGSGPSVKPLKYDVASYWLS